MEKSDPQRDIVEESLRGTRCPVCGSSDLRLDGSSNRSDRSASAIQCASCENEPRGRFIESEYRLDWSTEGIGGTLEDRVEVEVEKYDAWAEETTELDYPPREAITLDDWFARSEMMRQAAVRWPEISNLAGKRVLDIGGSCKDSWRFVGVGARRVDQVEVSPLSQKKAIRRLDEALWATDVEWRGNVWFHTAPAERLPFREDTFEFVFSRATIHHTQRPDVFREIHRVLKPGGLMFAIEPRYSLPMYALMRLSRFLRGADRGTDDPLRTSEIRALRKWFDEVDWFPGRFASTLWVQSVGRLIDRPDIVSKLRNWEQSQGLFMGIAYLTGSQCWIAARK